ncbi:unnamed protein product [Malus baccata var. baccata]
MASGKLLFLLVLLCACSESRIPFVSCSVTNDIPSECLKVPASEIAGSLRDTIGIVQQVASILSPFANAFGDFRLSNAISDCLDLLDFSADELNWSLSASQNPEGKDNSTGKLSSDLRTWLSAALVNQDTCSDGFEGTNSIVKGLVSTGLNQVTSLVQGLLTQVHPNTDHHGPNGEIPSWVKTEDRKLLQAGGVNVDAVVAQDGTGNFTNVMDAVLAAPDESMTRYVIYIKKGTYKENVEIKKKKWNLMMIGDGMDATIISGNRNFLLCIILFLHISSSSSSSNTTTFNPHLASLRSFCKSAPYPDICFDSLKLSISINITPNIISYLLQSLQVAISEAGKLTDLFYKAGQYPNIVEKQKGAVQDCKELHQITLSSLQRSVSQVQAGNAKKLNDARAYLSAALTNKNTCMEGLDSASGPMKPTLVNSLTSTYKYVSNSLSAISKQGTNKGRTNRRLMSIPRWLSRRDRRILESSGDEYDPREVLTVAADGSGNFTTISDAIIFAPNNSYDRTIIYVKEGVYEENVEIPSYKTNIVLLGDGSDITFITGNRSVVDGWTTFRSATDFDQLTERRKTENARKFKKRIIIAVVVILLLVLIAVGAYFIVNKLNNKGTKKGNAKEGNAKQGKAAGKPAPKAPQPKNGPPKNKTPSNGQKILKEMCSAADYKEKCEGIIERAKDETKPKAFIKTAISAASDEAKSAYSKTAELTFNSQEEKGAFEDCKVLFDDAKEELGDAVSQFGNSIESGKVRTGVLNSWLSAVISYQQTCVDGFPDGKLKSDLEKMLQASKEFTSNSLAMLSLFNQLQLPGAEAATGSNRRLLSQDKSGFPTWMSHEDRRMLKKNDEKITPNVTVAKDGSGNYKTISEALEKIPEKYEGRYVIYVKEGVYDETVTVTKKMPNVTIYGDGSQKSVITGNKNFADKVRIFQTAPFGTGSTNLHQETISAHPSAHSCLILKPQE